MLQQGSPERAWGCKAARGGIGLVILLLLAACLGPSCAVPGGVLDDAHGDGLHDDDSEVLDYRPEPPGGNSDLSGTWPGGVPDLVVIASPSEGEAPLNVAFDAYTMDGLDLPAEAHLWDFGDGETGVGRSVRHLYTRPGVFTVTVCLAIGPATAPLSGCKETRVEVRQKQVVVDEPGDGGRTGDGPPAGGVPNAPPIVNGQHIQTLSGQPVEVTLQGVDSAGGDLAFRIVTGPSHGSLGPVNHTALRTAVVQYTPEGGFIGSDSFTFTAASGDGVEAPPATVTIEIRPAYRLHIDKVQGLTAAGLPGGPFAPGEITYRVSNTASEAITYTVSKSAEWVGVSRTSGSLPVGGADLVTVSIQQEAANSLGLGTYSDTVVFTDTGDGSVQTRAVTLNVASPPVANAGADFTVDDAGEDGYEQVTLDGSASQATIGELVKYRWTKGQTVLSEGPSPSVTLTLEAGRHEMTLTVTDSYNQSASDSVEVVVQKRRLTPGTGFTGETPQPAPVGYDPSLPVEQRPRGWDAKAIARWDVVPFQTFDGDFNVGVVAFHMNGIDRVEFSVNGGPWLPVYQMTRNEQTANHSDIGVQTDGVVEYWATLRAADFADGPVEVRAIAWPKVGEPRLLEGLELYADPSRTLSQVVRWVAPDGSDTTGDGSEDNPFATMRRAAASIAEILDGGTGGGTVYLKAGDHVWAGPWSGDLKADRAFLTISAAPGVGVDQVRITASPDEVSYRMNVRLHRLHRITLRTRLGASNHMQPVVWVEKCILQGGHNLDNMIFFSTATWPGGIYATETTVKDVMNGISGAVLQRNVRVENIGSDSFQNTRMVLNCTVDGIDKGDTAAHPDIAQWHITSPLDNVIYYGMKATNAKAQGIFMSGAGGGVSNVAYVNVLLGMSPDHYTSQWGLPVNHLLIWHVTQPWRSFLFRDGVTTARNVSIKNSVFYYVGRGDRVGESGFENNHFITGPTYGSGWTVGDAGFQDDYSPGPTSVLRNRIIDILVPTDVRGNAIQISGSIGAVQ